MGDLVAVKPAARQATNYIAVAMVFLGNLLPALSPQLLIALGLKPEVATAALTIAGVILAAWQHTHSAIIVPVAEPPKPLIPSEPSK